MSTQVLRLAATSPREVLETRVPLGVFGPQRKAENRGCDVPARMASNCLEMLKLLGVGHPTTNHIIGICAAKRWQWPRRNRPRSSTTARKPAASRI